MTEYNSSIRTCITICSRLWFHTPIRLGIGIALHLNPSPGFFNANTFGGPVPEVDQSEIFHITDPAAASAIVSDYETVLDGDGKASITHSAKWARPKLAPLYCRILRAYAFMKDSDGFYRPGTLIDVTSRVKVVDNRTKSLTAEADCGRECAGMTLFIMVAQYYNYTQVFGNSQSEIFCRVMDGYADIPLDGIALDEFGYLYLDCRGDQPPFRGRLYSPGMKKYFAERLDTDIDRLLFDMRYAPSDDDSVRIRAINTYFRELRKPPAENERLVYEHAKKLFGDDIYFGTHATFHNELDNDDDLAHRLLLVGYTDDLRSYRREYRYAGQNGCHALARKAVPSRYVLFKGRVGTLPGASRRERRSDASSFITR